MTMTMILLIIILLFIFTLGFLAQQTGICMVKGVHLLRQGNPAFLLATLACGVLAWVAAGIGLYLNIPIQFQIYEPSINFAIGGVLIGFGAALNQACGISTLSRLSRGDFNFAITILGWLAGWAILAAFPIEGAVKYATPPIPDNVIYGLLIGISGVIVIWAMMGDSNRKKLWFGMMGLGLLASLIFLLQPKWTPSALLYDLSHAIINPHMSIWPSFERYLLFIFLLIGMFVAAYRAKQFTLVRPTLKPGLVHLGSGVLMGIGASLSMGGNDAQLLLAIPAFSIAGWISILGIIVGLYLGLELRSRVHTQATSK